MSSLFIRPLYLLSAIEGSLMTDMSHMDRGVVASKATTTTTTTTGPKERERSLF
jgi:hypothetical protein